MKRWLIALVIFSLCGSTIVNATELNIDKKEVKIVESEDIPYVVGKTSRANMMQASMSLVGKVRYVWGGGHVTTGSIDGISPIWENFNEEYGTKNGENGYGKAIVPGNNWCPIHGKYEDGMNACLYIENGYTSVENYLLSRKGLLDKEEEKIFKDLVKDKVNFEVELIGHRLDGLDCSGYVSWIFNQIDNSKEYDGLAEDFIARHLDKVAYGSEMIPGDIFAWYGHIVEAVGVYEKGTGVYVILEASPSVVKFGVMYYSWADQGIIDKAKKLAVESNSLIGNIKEDEETHVYNMDKLGYYNRGLSRYAEIGRYRGKFEDDTNIKDFVAKEVIQQAIDGLSEYEDKYISGLKNYKGTLLSTKKVKEKIKARLDEEKRIKEEEERVKAEKERIDMELKAQQLKESLLIPELLELSKNMSRMRIGK